LIRIKPEGLHKTKVMDFRCAPSVRIAHSSSMLPKRYLWPPHSGKKLFFIYEILDMQRCLRIDRALAIVLARTLVQ
jgi:hypothetical protein